MRMNSSTQLCEVMPWHTCCGSFPLFWVGWSYCKHAMLYLSVVVMSTYDRFKDNATALFYSYLQTRSLDQWSYLLLGLLLVVLIVFVENFYRTGVQPGTLRLRFFQVTTIEFGVLFLANLTSAMVIWDVSGFTWRSLFYPLLELITTTIFVWLWIDNRRRSKTALAEDQPA